MYLTDLGTERVILLQFYRHRDQFANLLPLLPSSIQHFVMMPSLLKFLILTLLIGVAKAHHLRLMVLAVLGLAGLWMVQNIARSSSGGGDRSGQLFPNFSVANLANRFLTKRSLDAPMPIDWDIVLANDHSTCTRSFVCQLSAAKRQELSLEEETVLNLIKRSSFEGASWANKQLNLAVRLGEKLRNRNSCMKMYKKCPYSSSAMLMLLNAIGERT